MCLFLLFHFMESCVLWDTRTSRDLRRDPASSRCSVSDLRKRETEQDHLLLFINSVFLLFLSPSPLKIKQVSQITVTSQPQIIAFVLSWFLAHSHESFTFITIFFSNFWYFCFSSASLDSGVSFLVKSGSISRSGTTTWSSPAAETRTQQTSTTSSSSSPSDSAQITSSSTPAACSSTANLPKAPNPGQARSPTQRHCSDQNQLEPIQEAPPESPKALVKITSPYKRKSELTTIKTQSLTSSVTQCSAASLHYIISALLHFGYSHILQGWSKVKL